MLCELCKRFLCSVTLAHEPAERDVRRAYIIYEPLYPSVQERLNRFRRGENAELFQRGAEQVVHNVGLYDTRRSSEDRSGDFPAPQQEGTATPGPIEASVDEEDCRVGSPRQDRQREPRENDMVSERGWLVLLVVLYMVGAVAVLATDNFTKKEWTEDEAQKELETAGVTLADILRKVSELREDNEHLREEVRRERAAWTQLNEEMQHLKQENERLRSRMEAEILSEVLSEGKKRQLEATRTWWEWLWGLPPPSVVMDTERVVIIEGCQDLKCCFEMWWTAVGELFHQSTDLIYRFVWDPYGTGGHWAFGVFSAGFWGPVAGISILLVTVNLLLLGAMHAADVWKGTKKVVGWLGRIPMFALVGVMISKLYGRTTEGRSPELQAVRKEIQALRKRIEDRQRKKKEESELRELREEVRNLQSGYGRRETAADDDAVQALRAGVERLQREITQLKRTPAPAVGKEGEGPRPRRGASPTPAKDREGAGAPSRWCPECGRWHAGECWNKVACEQCGKIGMCEHRRALVARRWGQGPTTGGRPTSRATNRTPSRPVSTCSEDMDEQHLVDLLLREEEVQVKEGSSSGSSISLSLKSSAEQQQAEGSGEVAAVHAPRTFMKGQLTGPAGTETREFLVDSGAVVNLLSEGTCATLGLALRPTKERVRALAGTPLKAKGEVEALTRFAGTEREVGYLVVEGNEQDILGAPGLMQFGFKIDFGKRRTAVVPNEQHLLCRAGQKN